MRELRELIELLDWTNNSDYNYLIRKKDAYLTHPDDDTFYELQGLAAAIYSDAKYAFSCKEVTIDELHLIQSHLLGGLYHAPK